LNTYVVPGVKGKNGFVTAACRLVGTGGVESGSVALLQAATAAVTATAMQQASFVIKTLRWLIAMEPSRLEIVTSTW
jgi:hypothetical protein